MIKNVNSHKGTEITGVNVCLHDKSYELYTSRGRAAAIIALIASASRTQNKLIRGRQLTLF